MPSEQNDLLATGAIKPGPWGEREGNRKTIAQGRPVVRPNLGDCRQLFLLLAGHGCGLHPAFPAPSVLMRDETDAQPGRDRAAGM
jgi:hypothetical protein